VLGCYRQCAGHWNFGAAHFLEPVRLFWRRQLARGFCARATETTKAKLREWDEAIKHKLREWDDAIMHKLREWDDSIKHKLREWDDAIKHKLRESDDAIKPKLRESDHTLRRDGHGVHGGRTRLDGDTPNQARQPCRSVRHCPARFVWHFGPCCRQDHPRRPEL
jgi:hypothetical protein